MTATTPSITTNAREYAFTLPIGVQTEDGQLHRDGALRKMNGHDEAILADPRYQRNGGQLVTELLHSCVTGISGIEQLTKSTFASMYSADRNFLLLKIRSFTFGAELQANYTCPSCGNTMQVYENLEELPVRELAGGELPDRIEVELVDGYVDRDNKTHTQLELRLPTGADEQAVAAQMRKNASLGKNALLARCIVRFSDLEQKRVKALGPRIMSDLTMSDRRLIDRSLNAGAPGIDLIRDHECVHCGHEFKASMDMTHFLELE
ncbi:MAG: phage tail assembly protein [Planctomycetota bacterium]